MSPIGIGLPNRSLIPGVRRDEFSGTSLTCVTQPFELGWLWFGGIASGAVIGLFFHDDSWMGGYGSFRRRMLRLGHISFFGMGDPALLPDNYFMIFVMTGGHAPREMGRHLAVSAKILRSNISPRFAYRSAVAAGWILPLVVLICLRATVLVAQSTTPSESSGRRFDVASIKPSLPLRERVAQGGPPPTLYDMRTLPGGRFTATMASLKMLVGYAFEVRDYQIEGGPKWLATDYFDVAATPGADAAPAEVRTMLRNLLTERFGLRVRVESRQAPVYVLSVARSDGRLGPELKHTTPECERQLAEQKTLLQPPRGFLDAPCGSMSMGGIPTGGFIVSASGIEIARLIALISSSVAAPVSDGTGLSGRFDFTLKYTPEREAAGSRPGLDVNSELPPPPIVTALQQQLGLKLQQQLGPVPTVVIDAASHPTPD